MKKILVLSMIVLAVLFIGCSDDDPVGPDQGIPELDSIGSQTVNFDSLLSINVTATIPDATTPELTISGLPTNATFVDNNNGSGSFNWTPSISDAGVYNVSFYATSPTVNTKVDSELVQITVFSTGGTPTLTTIGSQTVNTGSTLGFNVSSSMSDATNAVLTTSTLDANASFVDNNDGTGSFSWSPTVANVGANTITFYATSSSDPLKIDSEQVHIAVTAITASSEWDIVNGYWKTDINATSSNGFMYYSFTTMDTVSNGVPKLSSVNADIWDIAFRREEIKTNGGISTTNSGDLLGTNLGPVDFDAVTLSDTAGVSWESDYIDYFIDDWYNYNPVTHSLAANGHFYSMVDASGQNYLKFQVDSMVGAGMPPDMGSVYMKYFYQSTALSTDLSGAGVEVVVPVGAVKTYFDFSSGAVVTPADPTNSLDWDISFFAYEIAQNSGPNGIGDCVAFPAYTEMVDSTDFAGFTEQPSGAPMFPDIAGSILTEWYTYTGPPLHQLYSNADVYLLNTGNKIYKLRIQSYYGEAGDKASANYHLIWVEL